MIHGKPCACGGVRRDGQKNCLSCHAAYMRANRPRHSDLPEEQRRRANARSYANVYKRRGKLVPEPCKRCGGDDAEMHHHDYSQPLEVEWLCRPCHLTEHRPCP